MSGCCAEPIMTSVSEDVSRKDFSRAAALGMFMPLVGYAYVGRFARGMAALAVATLFVWSLSHLPFGLLDYRPIAFIAAISHFLAACGFCIDVSMIVRRGRARAGLWYQGLTFYVPLFAVWIAIVVVGHKINETTLHKAMQICDSAWGMEPTIRPKECVLVVPNRVWRRGDIALFVSDGEPQRSSFGRVIGLPGDVVAIRKGNPIVNGVDLSQTPTSLPPQDALSRWFNASTKSFTETSGDRSYSIVRERPMTERYQEIDEHRVPEAHLYLLGDARDWTMDSRSVGDIPISRALGKPIMVSRSPDWSRFGEPVR